MRCWVNRLNMPHNAAVIGAGARVKGWSTGRTYGSASAIVADRLDLGWPQDEEILPRTPEPPPLHVQSLLCISDSAGTLYPETVKGFKRLFGWQVPALVGASVTRKTGDIYRKWKKVAAINGRRSNSNPSKSEISLSSLHNPPNFITTRRAAKDFIALFVRLSCGSVDPFVHLSG